MKKQINWKSLLPKLLVLLVVIGVCAVLARKKFYALIMCLVCIYTIAVTGLDVLFGYSGQISFGQAGFFAIGAYASAILTTKLGWSPIPSMLVGGALAVVVAIILAIPACRLRKHFLSMLTIAFGQIVLTFVTTAKFTGAATGISKIPDITIFGYALDTRVKNLIFMALLMVFMVFIKNRIIKSRTGRALISIRENPVAAQGMGINVRFYKTVAFAVGAFYAAVAGSLYAHLMGYISPETFAPIQSTLFVTVLLFGGIGTLWGPVIGSAVILPIRELFQSFVQYQALIYALFIVVVLFFFPMGVVGVFDKLRGRLRRGKEDKANADT